MSSPSGGLRLVTWNVWFGEWRRADRQAALWAELDRLDPELICLQEVVPSHLDGPQIAARLARGQWRSHDAIYDYDALMLARRAPLGFERVELSSAMGRALLVARFGLDPPLTVATVHLESTRAMELARMEQLRYIDGALADDPNVVFVGDMNFAPDSPAQQVVEQAGWRDAWVELRGDEAGFTVDSERNHMRSLVNPRAKRARIDRVFVRGEGWRVRSIERLGMEALPDDPLTFISDHFGLLADLHPA